MIQTRGEKQGDKEKGKENKPLLVSVLFISVGEYIKLAEREKEPRSACGTRWEAETNLGALRELRNQQRTDNLHTERVVGKALLLSVYQNDAMGSSLWSI